MDPEMSGTTSDSKLLEEFVVAQMVCTACQEQLRLPIRHCIRGHALCAFCFFNARNCPRCGCAKNDTRAYVIEKIFFKVTFRCKWEIYGCPETHRGTTIGDHEIVCKFYQMPCPQRFDSNCDFKGTKMQVNLHCRSYHPFTSFMGSQIEVISTQNFREINLRDDEIQRQYYTIYVSNELFRVVWELKGPIARVSVNTVGQLSALERTFIFEIGFVNKLNNKIAKRVTGDCVHLTDDRLLFTHGTFVSAQIASLKRYCGSFGELYFTIKVIEMFGGVPEPLGEYDWTVDLWDLE